MHRYAVRDRLAGLDAERDCAEIYRTLATVEFPWDFTQSLGFALFRTFAVPSIGALLARTGEFTDRTQRRYDDTVLILDALLAHGVATPEGRTALRRLNRLHAAYDITAADMRYVLATFVVVPVRWLDAYGWRRLTDHEQRACVAYYRTVAGHMGIRDVPSTYAGYAELLDAYEAAHFAFDPGGRAVADATLDLFTTFAPMRLLPTAVALRLSRAVLDRPLLRALGYPQPSTLERVAVSAGLRLRGRVVRLLPPRRRPVRAADSRNIRSYPDGYAVADLGASVPPA